MTRGGFRGGAKPLRQEHRLHLARILWWWHGLGHLLPPQLSHRGTRQASTNEGYAVSISPTPISVSMPYCSISNVPIKCSNKRGTCGINGWSFTPPACWFAHKNLVGKIWGNMPYQSCSAKVTPCKKSEVFLKHLEHFMNFMTMSYHVARFPRFFQQPQPHRLNFPSRHQ